MWKPSLKLVETNLFGKDFVLVEMDFYPVETIFVYSVLLSCKWKLLLKLVETNSLYFLKMTIPNIYVKKQCQFGRDSKVTVK